MPTMPSGWPSMSTRVTVRPDETATPGVAATRSATSAVTTPRNPVPLTAKSAISWVSTDAATASRTDAANTVTNATRPTPIISADAVAAVRRGLRTAFSRASEPATPRRRVSGRPNAWQIGPATAGPRTARARKPTSAPSPRTRNPSPPCRAPRVTSAAATARPTAPAIARPMVLVVRSTSRSRSAASGEMVAARRPGIAADTVVTTTPTRTATTMVRAATTLPIVGSRNPSPASSDFNVWATPSPASTPTADAMHADDRRLQQHRSDHLAPAGAHRPQQAQFAACAGRRRRRTCCR